MGILTVTRVIEAPVDVVFRTVSEVNNFAKAVPDVVRIEILSEVSTGVGTRFRETRLIKGRETTTELEVIEHVPDERIRIVADSHGAVWDSVYTVAAGSDGGTELTLTMEGRPHTLAARLMVPLAAGVLRKTLEHDMEAVKSYCENPTI